MPILAIADAIDESGRQERLASERACRAYIKRIFEAVIADRWDMAFSAYIESKHEGEWFHVAVWAGLPMTVRSQLTEMERG